MCLLCEYFYDCSDRSNWICIYSVRKQLTLFTDELFGDITSVMDRYIRPR